MFSEFWKIYPRRVGKLAAMKAWERALRHDSPKAIIAGLQAHLPSMQATERQFIPHPTTWLNQGRWMDEVEQGHRTYAQWSHDEKQSAADFVTQNGRERAVRMRRVTHDDIQRLTEDGYLGPGKVAL